MHAGTRTKPPFTLRRLDGSDAAAYRELRLEGLRSHPEAFGVSWEDEASKPTEWFAERLKGNAVFGGWLDSLTLVGVAGLKVPEAAKLRHKGILWGMYVMPEARGSGLAPTLIARVVEHATDAVEEIQLTVAASNLAAVRLYARAGFVQYGLDRRALKIGDQYFDEMLMTLPLRQLG